LEKLILKKKASLCEAFGLFSLVYYDFNKLLSCSSNFGLEGLAASASITFPLGSIRINLGIDIIPKAVINEEFQFLSAKS
jgi:hypothetical protein